MADNSEKLAVFCLGGLRIERNGVVVTGWASRKAEALVVYLALTQRAHEREVLATLLWDDRTSQRALGNLSVLLTSLRVKLGDFVVVNRQTIGLDWKRSIWVDAFEFVGEAALAIRNRPAASTELDIERFERALELYAGDFLAGFSLKQAGGFDEWSLFEQERLRHLAVEGLDALVQSCLVRARVKPGIAFAQRLLALDPLRESSHRDLMRLLVLDGQRNAALAQFDRCFEILQRELGVEPDDETTALYEHIATGRLDISVRSDRSTLPVEAPRIVERHNLPSIPTSFIGRDAEVDRIRQRLDNSACRLLNLVGPGGAGKTRLALHAARERLGAHSDGVWFIPLASLADARGLTLAIAEAMQFGFSGDQDPFDQLLAYLRGKDALLVLDNLEHLIGDELVEILIALLASAPDIHLLTTSRERLNLDAEWLLDVAGLPFPADANDAMAEDFPAVQLFVLRAQRLRDGFVLTSQNRSHVVQLCQLMDGLPLALELAAAWIRTLAPADIVAEVQRSMAFLATSAPDVPARHRSVRAVFETSWQMLSPHEQEVFARLSVFRNSFDLAGARAVAGATLAALSGLVDKSFLRRDSAGRFRCHPLLLEFAGEQLAERPELQIRTLDLHAATFGQFLQTHETELHREGQAEVLHVINGELDNIRLAWRWAAERGKAKFFEQAVDAMLIVFDIDGLTNEALDLCRLAHARLGALELTFGDAESVALARVIALESSFEFRVGNFGRSRDLALDALHRLERHRAPAWAFGHTYLFLGAAYFGLGDIQAALNGFDSALGAYRQAGSAWGIGGVLGNIAEVHMVLGDQAAALSSALEAHEVIRTVANPYLLSHNAYRLAVLFAQRGDYGEARRYQEESLLASRRLNFRMGIGNATSSLGELALAQGDFVAAQQYYQEAIDLHRDTGARLEIARNLVQLGVATFEAGDIERALACLRAALMETQETAATAISLDALAQVARIRLKQGYIDEAVALLCCVQTHEASSQTARGMASVLLSSVTKTNLPAAVPCDLAALISSVLGALT